MNHLKNIFIFLLTCTFSAGLFAQVTLLTEDFENGGSIPTGWTDENISGSDMAVEFRAGAENGGSISGAHGGSYNADQGFCSASVQMIYTPELDFSNTTTNPTLTFWHAQEDWSGDQDELRVYYKTSSGGAWTLIQSYTSSVSAWTERTLTLPSVNSTYYVGFEFNVGDCGYGVQVDDVTITAEYGGDVTTEIGNPVSQVTGATLSSLVDTDGEAVKVFDFTITDGGDGDAQSTFVSQMTFKPGASNTADWTDHIEAVKIHDQTAFVTSTSSVADGAITVTLSTPFEVADGVTETISVYAYLTDDGTVTDGDIIDLRIDFDDHDFLMTGATSIFVSSLATGADIEGNSFPVDVVATQLSFASGAPASTVQMNTNFNVTVNATDVNGNVDSDETGSITVSRVAGSGTLSSVTGLTQDLSGGSYAWTDARYNTEEDFTIQATHASLTTATSGTISCFDGTVVTVGATGDVANIYTAYNTTIPANITGLGKYYIKILNDYDETGETFPLELGAKTGNSATDNVTIFPETGCETKVILALLSNTVEMNGTDYLTFDGRPGMVGDTSAIIIYNTSTSSSYHSLELSNGATNNVYKYVQIYGSNGGTTNSASGVVTIEDDTGSPDNTFSYCSIGGVIGGLCANAFVGQDPLTGTNDNITIDNCDIINWTQNGVDIENDCDDWTISNSHFFHTADLSGITSSMRQIWADYAGGLTVTGCYFGGKNRYCGGDMLNVSTSEQFYGVYFGDNCDGNKNVITNNKFSNFHLTSTRSSSTTVFIGVTSGGSSDFTISGNILGDTIGTDKVQITENGSASRTLTFYFNNSNGRDSIFNNTIGGITINDGTSSNSSKEYSLFKMVGDGDKFIFNNTLGNETAGNMNVDELTDVYIFNILDGEDSLEIRGNTIQNIDMEGSTSSFYGYYNTVSASSAAATIFQGNTFRNINSAGNDVHSIFWWDQFQSGTAQMHRIDSNVIDSFVMEATGTSARFAGIYCEDGNLSNPSPFSITRNTINNVQYAGTHVSSVAMSGITYQQDENPDVNTGIIDFNTVSNMRALNNTAINVSIQGIELKNDGNESYTLTNNLVYNLANNTSGASSFITGINLSEGNTAATDSLHIINNSIVIDNLDSTNSTTIYGIYDNTDAAKRIYHNTISIEGNNGSGSTTNSYCYYKNTDSEVFGNVIKNNVFRNIRTGGSGTHYAIYFDETSDYTIDYNYYEALGNLGFLISSRANLSAWQTATGQDANSVSGNINLSEIGQPGSSSLVGNAGEDLNVARDISNRNRDDSPWIGAYERDTVLPVEYISFTGNVVNETIELEWGTGSERNSDYFDVEKSLDGVEYTKIGQVNAAGNSIVNKYYSYLDLSPVNGFNYYRLNQFDIDGSNSISSVVTVIYDDESNHMIAIYPNPSTDVVYIDNNANDESAIVTLFNINGQVQLKINVQGNDKGAVDVTGLAEGIYFVNVQLGNQAYQEKIIVK